MAYKVGEVGWDSRYPLYTPAISMMYVRHLGREFGRDTGPMFPDVGDLNWYDPTNKYFTHPGALYSAGHAYLDTPDLVQKLEALLSLQTKEELVEELSVLTDALSELDSDADGISELIEAKNKCDATLQEIIKLEKLIAREKVITERDRSKTIFVADSGGYQIGRGVLKFDGDLKGPDANKLRYDILKWLEEYADYSMIIDFPAWAVGKPKFILNSFEECLEETIYNCDFISKNRTPGKIKFLNVVQGRNYPEAKKWYDSVKHFDFEGWSFAGPCAGDPEITVKLILNLWKDGLLNENKNWLHILGKSRLDAVWTNNIIHRCIQKYVSPEAQVSYDSASAYLMAAYGQIWHNHQIDHREMKFLPTAAPNDKALARCNAMFPWINKLTKNLPMNQFCMETKKITVDGDYDPDFIESLEENLKGDIGATDENVQALENYIAMNKDDGVKRSFKITESNNFIDSHAYAILMYHNTIIQMRAIEAINKISEFPIESMYGRLPSLHIDFKKEVENLFARFVKVVKDPSINIDSWIDAYNMPKKFKKLIDGSGEGGDGETLKWFEFSHDVNDEVEKPEEKKKDSFADVFKGDQLDQSLWDAPEIIDYDNKLNEYIENRGGSGKKCHIPEIKQSMAQATGLGGSKKGKSKKG